MTLKVDPFALRRFAFHVGQSAYDTTTARQYGTRWSELDWNEVGLISTARSVHGDFVALLTTKLNHLYDVLHTSEAHLHRAAGWYQQADTNAAARADESYPDPGRVYATPD